MQPNRGRHSRDPPPLEEVLDAPEGVGLEPTGEGGCVAGELPSPGKEKLG